MLGAAQLPVTAADRCCMQTFRLITRSDMDGLVCAVLLKEMGILGEIDFQHPKDVQDGKVEVSSTDILTNLPYVPGCHLCFDHHASEMVRNSGIETANHVIDPDAPSAARVVYDYYGGGDRFPMVSQDMMAAVDKADAAQFTLDDVLHPQGWELLSFLMDARTGLGRFRDFRISNYQLMMELIDRCRDSTIDEILALPDVAERVTLFREQHEAFRDQIARVVEIHDNLAVLDLRHEDTIFAGNRFIVYAMHPQCDISMHVMWGRERQNTVYTVGKSIFDRSNPNNIGDLMLGYGGGGHHAAGTCQVDNDQAESTKVELISKLAQRSRVTS